MQSLSREVKLPTYPLALLMVGLVGISQGLDLYTGVGLKQEMKLEQKSAINDILASAFSDSTSIGPHAIGAAEGNITVSGEKTQNYWRHSDPGNDVLNRGWCSDQGRGRKALGKGSFTVEQIVAQADIECLKYARRWFKAIEKAYLEEGYTPTVEEVINHVDLFNQANPRHGKLYAKALKRAKEQGKTGSEAIAHARTLTFFKNFDITTRTQARGLVKACRTWRIKVSEHECVLRDQNRRVQQIRRVLEFREVTPVTPKKEEPIVWKQLGQDLQNLAQSTHKAIAEQGKALKKSLPSSFKPNYPVDAPYQRIASGFDPQDYHLGVDFVAPLGTPIKAAEAGVVDFVGFDEWGLGNVIRLKHTQNYITVYGHLSSFKVKAGDRVKKGQVIGEMGSSGYSKEAHLHFEIRVDDTVGESRKNPEEYLPKRSTGGTYVIPAQGTISQGYHFGHKGIDIAAPGGTPIYAIAPGKVVWAGKDPDNIGYGRLVKILHDDGTISLYAHTQNEIAYGARVQAGTKIAEIGAGIVGNSTGPHLHFELIKEGEEVDPGLIWKP